MMHKTSKKFSRISVVSALFNDEAVVGKTLPALLRILRNSGLKYELVLVDDASSDATVSIAKKIIRNRKDVRLFCHTKNEGISKTYRELYGKARGDAVVLFSLDGEWDPRDVVALARAMQRTKSEIVVGVRRKKQYTMWRSFVSYAYNMITRTVFGCETYDAGSIKIMRRDIATRIPIVSRGVFDEAERLIRAKRMGYTISALPIRHLRMRKKAKGIDLGHVVEAVGDAIRVWRSAGS